MSDGDEDFRGHIPAGNFEPGRRGETPTHIVLHHEACHEDSAENWFQNPASGVSAHGGINMDGSEDTFVDWGDTAYHAGNLLMNLISVGFEHEDGGDPGDPFTDVQYARSAASVAAAAAMFNIPLNREHVIGHHEVPDPNNPGGTIQTGCPGGLDIDRIIQEAITPVPAHDWRTDVVKTPAHFDLVKAVNVVKFANGQIIGVVQPGPLDVAGTYSTGGASYYVTDYALSKNDPHGMFVDAVQAAVAPPAPPVPPQPPVPDPVPPQPPTPPIPPTPPVPPVPDPTPTPQPGPQPQPDYSQWLRDLEHGDLLGLIHDIQVELQRRFGA